MRNLHKSFHTIRSSSLCSVHPSTHTRINLIAQQWRTVSSISCSFSQCFSSSFYRNNSFQFHVFSHCMWSAGRWISFGRDETKRKRYGQKPQRSYPFKRMQWNHPTSNETNGRRIAEKNGAKRSPNNFSHYSRLLGFLLFLSLIFELLLFFLYLQSRVECGSNEMIKELNGLINSERKRQNEHTVMIRNKGEGFPI